jgi:hypothetical protein
MLMMHPELRVTMVWLVVERTILTASGGALHAGTCAMHLEQVPARVKALAGCWRPRRSIRRTRLLEDRV